MGFMTRIAAKTASKKARRIANEDRRRKVLAKRRAGRKANKGIIKEYAKESVRPFLTKEGKHKLFKQRKKRVRKPFSLKTKLGFQINY